MHQRTPIKRPQASPGERTRIRILDAAEELFAREGPAAVTLRSIAAAGGVNVAAVNYYFGSKEKLFEEMFLRRIVPLNEERLSGLAARVADAGGRPTLEGIVKAYVSPALRLIDGTSPSARAIVVQYSLGRVLAIPEVNQMLARYYARVREAFVAVLEAALPHLTRQEVVWRYYWMGGSLMVALAVPPGGVGPSDGEGGPSRHSSYIMTLSRNLVEFLVQGMSAAGSVADATTGNPVAGRHRGRQARADVEMLVTQPLERKRSWKNR